VKVNSIQLSVWMSVWKMIASFLLRQKYPV
jgi:hypothetical protein